MKSDNHEQPPDQEYTTTNSSVEVDSAIVHDSPACSENSDGCTLQSDRCDESHDECDDEKCGIEQEIVKHNYGIHELWTKIKLHRFQCWNLLFFSIMAMFPKEWDSSKQGPWKHAFSYDQFRWVTDLDIGSWSTPTVQSTLAAMSALNILAPWTPLAWTFLQFGYIFSSTMNFVNHDYLYALLGSLTVCCHTKWFSFFKLSTGPMAVSKLAVVAIRLQFCVLYFFAFLWKLHPDWISGRCVRELLLSLTASGRSNGVQWDALESTFGAGLWQFVAINGCLLDSLMFMFVLLAEPGSRLLVALKFLFHGFNFCVLSGQIGFTFPSVCVASLFLFLPMEDDCALWRWIGRTVRTKKIVFLAYAAFHVLMPLRMPFFSEGNYPRTYEAYRFSWTMVLHTPSTDLVFKTHRINMFQMRPVCDGNRGVPRQMYTPKEYQVPYEDPQTFPESLFFKGRSSILLKSFSRSLPSVSGAISDGFKDVCSNFAMHAVMFSDLNGDKIFRRLVDPSVNLVSVHEAKLARNVISTLWGVFRDRPPHGFEYYLRAADSIPREQLEDYKEIAQNRFKREDNVRMIVDRSACLKSLTRFWVMTDYSKKSKAYVKLFLSPTPLVFRFCSEDQQCEDRKLQPEKHAIVNMDLRYIDVVATGNVTGSCAETPEDVAFAISLSRSKQEQR